MGYWTKVGYKLEENLIIRPFADRTRQDERILSMILDMTNKQKIP